MGKIVNKIEVGVVNFINKTKVFLVVIWFAILVAFCLSNFNIVYIKIPFTGNEIYFPLCLLIILSFPVWSISKFFMNIFNK